MDILFVPLFRVTNLALGLYLWAIMARVLLRWLIMLGVVNPYNALISSLDDFFERVTEPVLQPLRRVLPIFEGIDLSPLAAILAIYFLRDTLDRLLMHMGA